MVQLLLRPAPFVAVNRQVLILCLTPDNTTLSRAIHTAVAVFADILQTKADTVLLITELNKGYGLKMVLQITVSL